MIGALVDRFTPKQGDKFRPWIFWGAIAFISFLILHRFSVERIRHTEHDGEKFNYFKTIKSFFTSRPIVGLVVATLGQIIFIISAMQLNQMTFQMYFGEGKLNSLSILAYLLPMIIGAPLVKPFVKKFGKQSLVSWPLLGSIVIYLIMWLVPITNPYIWIGFLILASMFSFGSLLVGWAMVSDTIDYSEYQTGRREEGSIYATYSMIRKLGQGVGQALVPALIALFIPGLIMNDPTSWNVEYSTAIKNMSVIFPLIGTILMFVGYKFIYNLDKTKLSEIEAKLGRNSKTVDTSLEAITRTDE
jgi:GPH family glycoside/pentoside/hexuronide:cation symporter